MPGYGKTFGFIQRSELSFRPATYLAPLNKFSAMVKLQIQTISPQVQREIIETLTYRGKIAAIRQYKRHAGCRLQEARLTVDRLSREIEPGQAPQGS